MDKKTQFLKVYANLPLGVREEIVVVVEGEPLTWNSARIEVEQETEKGKQILETLSSLKILS